MKYVGWDWASKTHDVTVLDDTGAADSAATATPTICR